MLSRARFPQLSIQFSVQSEITAIAGKTYRHRKNLSSQYQSISKAFVRSDNAGCYQNGPLLLCLHEVAKDVGVNLIRYDFSEPQAGKDICDRKTAPMKAHIRRFVNENNDVTTAEEMNKALVSHMAG